MRARNPLFSLLIVVIIVIVALPLRATTPASELWLVTSAKTTGKNGEQYVSSLRLVNPSATVTANVTLYLLTQTALDANGNALGDNSGATTTTLQVPPGQTVAADDYLNSLFGLSSGVAGLRITSDDGSSTPNPVPIIVLSQTLVANARSATGVPGTNGFAIPAQTGDDAVGQGDVGYVPYLSAAPDTTQGYRSNLFLLSLNNTTNTTVNVNLVKGDGTSLGTKTITLGNWSQTQINNIGPYFGYSQNDTNLTAEITVVPNPDGSVGGPVVTGASIIDNAIASISYAPPTKTWLANDGAFGILLDDGQGYALGGRLDFAGGMPDYFSATVVPASCTGYAFIVQAWGQDFTLPTPNTTFTATGNGSYAFLGQASDGSASWTGAVFTRVDRTIYGTIAYTRSSSASPCPNGTVTVPFEGAWVASNTYAYPPQ